MLAREKIDAIARKVAKTSLGSENVTRVMSESIVDSQGEDALRVVVVIPEDALDRISGQAALNTLLSMQKNLQKAGDDRFAIIEYATQEELDAIEPAEP